MPDKPTDIGKKIADLIGHAFGYPNGQEKKINEILEILKQEQEAMLERLEKKKVYYPHYDLYAIPKYAIQQERDKLK